MWIFSISSKYNIKHREFRKTSRISIRIVNNFGKLLSKYCLGSYWTIVQTQYWRPSLWDCPLATSPRTSDGEQQSAHRLSRQSWLWLWFLRAAGAPQVLRELLPVDRERGPGCQPSAAVPCATLGVAWQQRGTGWLCHQPVCRRPALV